MIAQAAGKIGGTVFARNKTGLYARNWAKPTNPNSARQVDQRGWLTAAASAWKVLTDTQRAAWNEYAAGTPVMNRLGETVHLTGQNFYMKLNILRLQANLATDPTAPGSPGTGNDPLIEDIELNDGGSAVANAILSTLSEYYTAATDRIFAYVGLPVSPGVNFYKGPWFWAGVLPGNTVQPMEFIDLSTNTGITMIAGQSRYVAFRMLNADGKVSNLVIGGPFTVANNP